MPFPSEAWQWPVLAGLLVVVGWTLWVAREDRARHEARIERLLDAAQVDRAKHLEQWERVWRENLDSQHQLAEGLSRLCVEIGEWREEGVRERARLVEVVGSLRQ